MIFLDKTNMKTVATFSYPYEAQIAQGVLESEGVMSQVLGESSVYPGFGNIKGFELQLVVNDEDYERAASILAASSSAE